MPEQASQSVDRGEPQDPDWFRKQRMAIGLSLTELGREVGAPIQTVSRWEHGQNRPPWPYPARLAAVFHVEVAEVVLQLWGELVGGSCPERNEKHDCNGITILPDDPLVPETLQPALRQYASRALGYLSKSPALALVVGGAVPTQQVRRITRSAWIVHARDKKSSARHAHAMVITATGPRSITARVVQG